MRAACACRHVRLDKDIRVADALTFLAADAQPGGRGVRGDIIGLHNHGTINIGDTFSEGETLTFTGVPNFAPELFRRAVLKDPLRMKALQKGLSQLCEEGATQLFKPLRNNDLILGAIGQLQFEVVAFRLQDEYGVQCVFEAINVAVARWVRLVDEKRLAEFRQKAYDNLAVDHAGELVYLAPTRVQPRLDRGALAGDRLHEDPREPRGLNLRTAAANLFVSAARAPVSAPPTAAPRPVAERRILAQSAMAGAAKSGRRCDTRAP